MTKDEMETRARTLLAEAYRIRLVVARANRIALAKEDEAKHLRYQIYALPQVAQQQEAPSVPC